MIILMNNSCNDDDSGIIIIQKCEKNVMEMVSTSWLSTCKL